MSEKVYMLGKNTAKMGLGMSLKVMAGDVLNIKGKLIEPLISIVLAIKDAKQILLNRLEKYFTKKGISIPDEH